MNNTTDQTNQLADTMCDLEQKNFRFSNSDYGPISGNAYKLIRSVCAMGGAMRRLPSEVDILKRLVQIAEMCDVILNFDVGQPVRQTAEDAKYIELVRAQINGIKNEVINCQEENWGDIEDYMCTALSNAQFTLTASNALLLAASSNHEAASALGSRLLRDTIIPIIEFAADVQNLVNKISTA